MLPSTIRAVHTKQKKHVGLFKIAFPVIALTLIVLVFFGPQDPSSRVFQLDNDDAKLLDLTDYQNFNDGLSVMENVRFVGVDNNNNPFTVLANFARQSAPNAPVILLDDPVALITSKEGEKAVLRARHGKYHRSKQTMELEEEVSYLNGAGQYAYSDKAMLNLREPFSTPDGRKWQVKAIGDVRLKTQQELASSEEAYFNLDKNLLILNKEVSLKKDQSILRGDQIETDVKTGTSRVIAAPQKKGAKEKKRITGTFVPKKKKD